MWERQIPALRAAGYRCIAYDRVGWGRSELEAGADPGSATDDLQALLALLRVDRFHLVGTAAGAIVAIDYALSFPDRLRSLTASNTIGGVQDADYLALSRRLRPSPQFEALPVEVRELGPSYRAANPDDTARWVALSQQSRNARPLPAPQTPRHRVDVGAPRIDSRAGAAHHRWRGPLCAAAGPASVRGAGEGRRDAGRARGRALGLLGRDGFVQPDAPRLPRTILAGMSHGRLFTFVGGDAGPWEVVSQRAVIGDGLELVDRLRIVPGEVPDENGSGWILRGVTSHERYVTREEKTKLVARAA